MLNANDRRVYGPDETAFRDTVRKMFEKELLPNLDRFEEEGLVSRDFWRACGDAGMLCPGVPEEYGGLGLDFRYNAIIDEELAYAGSSAGITLQSDIVADYLVAYGSPEQKAKYLPKMISGEVITAIAMTEPGAGSDLQGIKTTARKDGNHYVINGSKTYITNGQNADLIIVVAKTDPEKGAKGTSLILVEADREGFARGRNLDKIGQNKGFIYLMSQLPQERLSIAISAQAGAQRAFDEAVKFVKERKAFGKTVWDFQNTQFVLAGLKTELQVGWAHIDWGLQKLIEGKLTDAEASAAKLWHTELQGRVCDEALQLHGGAGYMNEYPIARLWRDARVQRIYGGTSEIMKLVVSRTI